jgi:hypothetical protein
MVCPFLHTSDILVNNEIVNTQVLDYYTKLLTNKIKERKDTLTKLEKNSLKLICNICKFANRKKIILDCKKHMMCEACYKKNIICNKCN